MHIVARERVTGVVEVDRGDSAGLGEQCLQPARLFRRGDGIPLAGAQQHGHATELGGLLRLERDHRAKEDGVREGRGAGEHHARGDVRTVRQTDRNEPGRVELVLGDRAVDEANELLRAEGEILEIEHPFGEPPEKSRRTVLAHGAARGQDRRAGK